MVINGTDSSLNTLKRVGCQKFIDRKIIHDRLEVVHLVLCFLQAFRGGKREEGEGAEKGEKENRKGR